MKKVIQIVYDKFSYQLEGEVPGVARGIVGDYCDVIVAGIG